MESADIKMLPVRHIYRMAYHEEGFGDIKRKDNLIRGQELKVIDSKRIGLETEKKYLLDTNTIKKIKQNAISSEKNTPTYYYFLHEKKDSILTAYQMGNLLDESSIMLDHVFIGNDPTSCLKKRKQVRIGLELNYIEKIKTFNTEKKGKLLGAIISSLISIVGLIIQLITTNIDGKPLLQISSIPDSWPLLVFLIFAFAALYFIICGYREQQSLKIEEIKKQLLKIDDNKFEQFICHFDADDYSFPKLKNVREGINIICPLSMYSSKEVKALLQYLKTNKKKAYWWVFFEENYKENPPVLDKSSDNYERYFYRVLPLTYAEKQRLASIKDSRDKRDPGLKIYGVDYIASTLLPMNLLPESETDDELTNRLNIFVEKNKEYFPFDIASVIRLVAELSVRYGVDFSDHQYWNDIFSYSKTDVLSMADRKLSAILLTDKGEDSVKNLNKISFLISQILGEFEKNLYQVVKLEFGHKLMTEDRQLYLIKAIRCNDMRREEDCCLSIAENLYYQLRKATDNPDAFKPEEWSVIIEQGLLKLQKHNYGWFTVSLIHFLLDLWEKRPSDSLKDLLSTQVILKSSSEQIVFFNHAYNFNESKEFDVIEDHFRLLNIITEKPRNRKDLKLNPFSWTSLINLSDDERLHYEYALNNVDNQLIGYINQYYPILFNMFTFSSVDAKRYIYRQFYPSLITTSEFQDRRIESIIESLIEKNQLNKSKIFENWRDDITWQGIDPSQCLLGQIKAEDRKVREDIYDLIKKIKFHGYILQLLKITEEMGTKFDCYAKEGCTLLKTILFDGKKADNPGDLTRKCLYYMALWETIGFSIGSFTAAIIFQESDLMYFELDDEETSEKQKSPEYQKRFEDRKTLEEYIAQLNFGNYVARLVFFAHLESKKEQLYNHYSFELTDMLVAYKYPTDPLIGYILYISLFPYPEKCNILLFDYFNDDKRKDRIKPPEYSQVGKDELIQYIGDIFACDVLNDNAKEIFFKQLRNDFEKKYADVDKSEAIKIYLSMFLSEDQQKETIDLSEEEIIEKAGSDQDLVFLLYWVFLYKSGHNKTFDNENAQDKEDKTIIERAKICVNRSEQFINTSFINGLVILIQQWLELLDCSEKESSKYWDVARQILKEIHSRCLKYDANGSIMTETEIIMFYRFICVVEEKKDEWENKYSTFFSKEDIEKSKAILSKQNMLQIRVYIEDEKYSRKHKKVTLLGILFYVLRNGLMKNGIGISNPEYKAYITETDREKWLQANIMSLKPIVYMNDGKTAISIPFFDAVKYAIRNIDPDFVNKVQFVIGMHITSIVDSLVDDEKIRNQIMELVEKARHTYVPTSL